MKNQFEKVEELDGKNFYYSVLAGAQRIFDHQNILNKINVFPVADADTGTNLAFTMRSIVDSHVPTDSPKLAAAALAEAAIAGARGNSGIIFAQFLYGISCEIQNEENLDVNAFANIVKKAVKYAYEAIAHPVEGTMITVIKAWAEYIYLIKDTFDDFVKLVIEALKVAYESLKNTTRQLEVLAKANVVDAGAKAFVLFLEGMADFFKNPDTKNLFVPREIAATADFEAISHEKITFRYCTEAMISLNDLSDKSKFKLKEKIEKFGDSLVIAGPPKKMRLHIHTDEPAKVFAILSQCGTISYQKVDDMVKQNEIVTNRKWNIALLTDSVCDLPQEIIDNYQIHTLPLNLHFGENRYLDKVTITPNEFYKMLDKSNVYPTSSQPSSGDFQNKFAYLSTNYDSIIAVHISDKLSGTFSTSQKAADFVRKSMQKPINVVNSRVISGTQGLLVLRIAQAIERELSFEEINSKIEDWIDKTQILVSPSTLKYFIKGGRISPMKGLIAKILNVKPIITMDKDGNPEIVEKKFSQKANIKKVIKTILYCKNGKKIWNYCLVHANNESLAMEYSIKLEKIIGVKPAFVYNLSPVVGISAGSGTVAVALMYE